MPTDLQYGAFEDQFPSLFHRLKKSYDERGRHYHTWAHIEALLKHLSSVLERINDPAAVELAIYYHDAIYKPFSKSNEHDSARLLEKELKGQHSENAVGKAVCMIETTAGHMLPEQLQQPDSQHELSDCKYFLDMDISILGAEPDLYDWYEKAIRKEYALVPGPMFRAGRKKILQSFLERDTIYYTEYFRDKLEEKARINLTQAINALT